MSKLTDLIVQIALNDIGQKEKSGNSGFVSAVKEKAMKAVGWLKGQPWCAYNAEDIWVKGFTSHDPLAVRLLTKYFSGSAVQTFRNFKASREFKTSKTTAVLGALVVWQSFKNGVPTQLGHIGVVVSVNGNLFESVEGNTSEIGSREGTIVGRNKHNINAETAKQNGLQFIGFVYPIRIA